MKNKKNKTIGIFLIIVGFTAILTAAGFYIYNAWDEERAAEAAAETVEDLVAQINERGADPTGSPVIEIDGVSYIGVLSIPALGLSLPVDETWSYPKLKNSPCRYAGDIYNNTLVIAAHNYKKHFGNISILEEGDEIVLTDADDVEHNYFVVSISNVGAMDVHDVVENGYDLTLFTCTYNGQARVVVKCMREQATELPIDAEVL